MKAWEADLFVAELGDDHFVVKASEGNADVAFAWRLSAHRKGYGEVRLERVEKPGSEGAGEPVGRGAEEQR
ncbi:MAG: hypothetical protein H8E35_08310 [Ardenticatenia bacterium]|nr:hypothetical protein [Ardenticatenia bacterium]